jgi:hypothetical protein
MSLPRPVPTHVTDLDPCNKILDVSENAGLKYENYHATIRSKTPIDLITEYSPQDIQDMKKRGILVIQANRNDFGSKVPEPCKTDSPYHGMVQRFFDVPFVRLTGQHDDEHCPDCSNKMTYVNGSHQYLDRYSCLNGKSKGWLHTKNQYMCPGCNLYVVRVQRSFIFVNTGYYVLIVHLGARAPRLSGERNAKKTKNQYRKPAPIYGLNHDSIPWDGKCMVCGIETVPWQERGDGGVTGKRSLYSDSVCPECYLVHHAEEHDD